MAELGTRLKEARLSKGYSLDDLQEITKIQKRYLVGIEEGNYSIMPGTFYVRAFIKQYAEAVGLNADELLEEFKGEIPNSQPEDVAQSISYSSTRRSISSRSSSRMMETMPKVIVALFIVVIIAVIWFLYSQKVQNTPEEVENDDFNQLQYDQKNPTPTENAPNNGEEDNSDSEEVPTVEEEPVDEEPTVTQTISPGEVQSDGITTIYELSGAEAMNIRVEVSGDTWVSIRNENGEEQVTDRVYKASEVVEHDSTENGYARIRLGNANYAKVFVNDEEIKYTLAPTEPGKSTQNIIITFSQEQ